MVGRVIAVRVLAGPGFDPADLFAEACIIS
jgi:hypothetical protein